MFELGLAVSLETFGLMSRGFCFLCFCFHQLAQCTQCNRLNKNKVQRKEKIQGKEGGRKLIKMVNTQV